MLHRSGGLPGPFFSTDGQPSMPIDVCVWPVVVGFFCLCLLSWERPLVAGSAVVHCHNLPTVLLFWKFQESRTKDGPGLLAMTASIFLAEIRERLLYRESHSHPERATHGYRWMSKALKEEMVKWPSQ
ncbi:hypothetical protein LIA77_03275 [Sarocladium implicatum]|nr:hypothetical protein LIA77_03275 [Sarocladium implicatum]